MRKYSRSIRKQNVSYTKNLLNNQRNLPIEIGEYTYGRPEIYADYWPCKVKIGKFCSIAKGVQIFLDAEHRVDWVTTYPFPVLPDFPEAIEIKGHPCAKGDVIIGNDVWIGSEAIILSGVTIGDGAVIGHVQ
jgi:acetyltransferase-like isoleucine patch superfamily enzyme